MHLRSLALLVFVFAASAAFAGYLGMKYGEVTPQRAVQSQEPAPELVLQSAQPVAAPWHSAGASPSASKPAASTAPATDSTQTPTLASPPAFERNNSQDTNRPAGNAPRAAGANAADGVAISGSTTGRAPNCNTQACSDAYRSFDAADCTYKPANRPRRTCKK